MYNDKARAVLEQADLKKTPGRVAILNCLLSEKAPLTHQEILEKLTDFQINEVSIYRTLETFDRAGIVHKIEGVDKVWRFAISGEEPLNADKPCHPHFVCTNCGKVECLTELEIPKLKPSSRKYVINSREMVLKGSCDQCAN